MATWYYQQDADKIGPIDSKQLKELAASGKLKKSDLVWRDGFEQWVQARKIKDLFPASNHTPPPLPLPPENSAKHDEEIESKDIDPNSKTSLNSESLKEVGAKLGSSAMAIGSAAGNLAKASFIQAEITKIQSVSLPLAFRKLGEAVCQDDQVRNEWPDLTDQILKSKTDIAQLKSDDKQKQQPISLSERAKSLAGTAKTKGKTLAIEQTNKKRFTELGMVAFEKFGNTSGPENLVADIVKLRARLDQLKGELGDKKTNMATASGKSVTDFRSLFKSNTKAVIAVGGMILVCFAICGGILSSVIQNPVAAFKEATGYSIPDDILKKVNASDTAYLLANGRKGDSMSPDVSKFGHASLTPKLKESSNSVVLIRTKNAVEIIELADKGKMTFPREYECKDDKTSSKQGAESKGSIDWFGTYSDDLGVSIDEKEFRFVTGVGDKGESSLTQIDRMLDKHRSGASVAAEFVTVWSGKFKCIKW